MAIFNRVDEVLNSNNPQELAQHCFDAAQENNDHTDGSFDDWDSVGDIVRCYLDFTEYAHRALDDGNLLSEIEERLTKLIKADSQDDS